MSRVRTTGSSCSPLSSDTPLSIDAMASLIQEPFKDDTCASPAAQSPFLTADDASLFGEDLYRAEDDASLFGCNPRDLDSSQAGPEFEQVDILPFTSTGLIPQPTRVAFSGLILPPPAPRKPPTPPPPAEKPDTIRPVGTGFQTRERPLDAQREMAYPGAQIPGQQAAQARDLPAMELDEEAVLRGAQDPEYMWSQVDASLDWLNGVSYEPPAQDRAAVQEAEAVQAGPTNPVPAPKKRKRAKPTTSRLIQPKEAQKTAGNEQSGPADPALDIWKRQVQEGLAGDVAARKWGDWDPRRMCQPGYIWQRNRGGDAPYDMENMRDVYDYLQAFTACCVWDLPTRPWSGNTPPNPTAEAGHWYGEAWKMWCTLLLMQHEEKFLLLPEDLRRRFFDFGYWPVQRWTLNGCQVAEQAVDVTTEMLMAYRQMPGNVQQARAVPAEPREVVVID